MRCAKAVGSNGWIDSMTMKTRLGTFLSLGSPSLAELAALCGYDWVLMDLEHGCEGEWALPHQLRALRGSPTLGVVRVGAPHADGIGRVLDWGAAGIMVPHVNSAQEAKRVVDSLHYPPRGHRGVSRTVRAMDYGLRPVVDSAQEPIFLAQIETWEGVGQAEAIAAVPGVTALFVGPADLRHDLRVRGLEDRYDEALELVIQSAQRQGKAAGILVRQQDDWERLRALNFEWLALDSDLSLVREGFQRNLTQWRARA
jgi:2-dehydro-3-deoxyglucarate aldolase/4-hydroxy-2-oxoheptanedioate aldolase